MLSRIVVEVEDELKKDAQRMAIDIDGTLKDVVENALKAYLYPSECKPEENKEVEIK